MAEKSKAEGECIQVVVRCRPFNEKEKRENRTNIIAVDAALRQVTIKAPPNVSGNTDAEKSFTFDAVYDENTVQRFFYEESCFNLVENVLEGFNATIFAYGQTGCGKSWTMQGPSNPPELQGVIPNSFAHLFEHINSSSEVEFLVRCSYLEIYNEEIRDLLGDHKSKIKCELKEDPTKGVFVKNLTDMVVENQSDLQAMLDKGLACRTVAATLMNDSSSRSHSIFTIVIEMSTKNEKGEEHIRAGKLNLVDLAGSERQKKTGAAGAQLKEGAKINLSLSALGNVISALAENKNKHIPYRDSKLTRLLQDSLGGNTKTLMVAAISPADYNYEETLSTLRYANRAKNIQNKPKINEDPKETLLREYKEEIDRLKKLLEGQAAGGAAMIGAITAAANDIEQYKEGGGSGKSSKLSPRHITTNNGENDKNTVVESIPGPGTASDIDTETYGVDNDTLSGKGGGLEGSMDSAEEVLNVRIKSLQSKLVRNGSLSNLLELKEESSKTAIINPEQQAQLEEAAKRYKERKLEAKKKRELKQQEAKVELQRILDEKNEEFEELKQVANTGQSQLDKMEIKYGKMKKRYEKKIHSLEVELDDVNDELYNQRQLMQDSVTAQELDLKLYEQICRSLLSDKEFNRVVEKSKWDDDNEEWILPFFKQSSSSSQSQSQTPYKSSTPSSRDDLTSLTGVSVTKPSSSNRVRSANGNSSQKNTPPKPEYGSPNTVNSSNFLPDIMSNGSHDGDGTATGNGGYRTNSKMGKRLNDVLQHSKSSDTIPPVQSAGYSSMLPSLLPPTGGGSRVSTGSNISSSSGNTNNNNRPPRATSANKYDTNNNKDSNNNNRNNISTENIPTNIKPKKKKKKKKQKSNVTAEMASGRPAGDVSEWGFLATGPNGSSSGTGGDNDDEEEEYEDDDDFVTDETDNVIEALNSSDDEKQSYTSNNSQMKNSTSSPLIKINNKNNNSNTTTTTNSSAQNKPPLNGGTNSNYSPPPVKNPQLASLPTTQNNNNTSNNTTTLSLPQVGVGSKLPSLGSKNKNFELPAI